jgi:hypothetical protein
MRLGNVLEFDPYLCNAVMSKMFKNEFLLEKSKFIKYLEDGYNKRPEFAKKCRENVLEKLFAAALNISL